MVKSLRGLDHILEEADPRLLGKMIKFSLMPFVGYEDISSEELIGI